MTDLNLDAVFIPAYRETPSTTVEPMTGQSPSASPGQSPRRAAWTPLLPTSSNRVHPSPPTTPVHRLAGEDSVSRSSSTMQPLCTESPAFPATPARGKSDLTNDLRHSLFTKSMRALGAALEDDKSIVDKHTARRSEWSESGAAEDGMQSAASSWRGSLLVHVNHNRLIAKQYGQGLLASMIIAAINLPLVYALSRMPWHVVNENPAPGQPAIDLNHKTYQLSLFFQTIFPLSLYSVVLYACIKSTWKMPRYLLVFVGIVVSLSVTAAGVIYRYDAAIWFYTGDFVYIALSYVPSMCAVGWFLAEDGATHRERLADLLMVALLETVVAAAAILYCIYLMPFFYMLSAWGQLAWMCILHPVYFEFTTAILLRMVLRRNASKGRTGVQWFLSIIHGGVHATSISCILTSSIDSFGVTVLTQVICSACKLVWRSSTNFRDIWVERIGKRDFTYNHSAEDQAMQNRMVAVGIQTEMILENASNVLAPWLIWCTWTTPLFMSVAPEQLVSGGEYPAYYVICLILALVVVTGTFDLVFLWLNYHSWQQLPIIETWREMRRAGWWYFGFLTYALTFMGIMFLFITMLILPRAGFCNSDNYCDCKLMTLQAVCDGEYISTLGGNII